MSNFCAQCGSEVKENFKFCPNCGAEIPSYPKKDKIEKKQNTNEIHQSVNEAQIIICDNCGEENPLTETTCISCGARLKNSVARVAKKTKVSKTQKPETSQTVKSLNKKKNRYVKKKNDQKKQANTEKEIDSKKIILIAASIAILALVILLTSGVFESQPSVTSNISGNTQNNESGINLNNIQQINELEAKLKANPNDRETLLKLAHLQNDSGFYEKAIPLYQKYLAQVPSDADARIDMGVCYYNIRDYDSAIKEIKIALTYKPDHQIGNLNLGIVNLAAGNMKEAMKWLQKAVDLGPETDIGKRAKELLNSHKQ